VSKKSLRNTKWRKVCGINMVLNSKSGVRSLKLILPQQEDTVHDKTEVFSVIIWLCLTVPVKN
jgi:hypothetical protein